MKCLGRNRDQHCCWMANQVCQYLEENTEPGYRWSCGLRRELGSWDAVLADPRYLNDVQPKLDQIGPNLNCRDYPSGDYECRQCYG